MYVTIKMLFLDFLHEVFLLEVLRFPDAKVEETILILQLQYD